MATVTVTTSPPEVITMTTQTATMEAAAGAVPMMVGVSGTTIAPTSTSISVGAGNPPTVEKAKANLAEFKRYVLPSIKGKTTDPVVVEE